MDHQARSSNGKDSNLLLIVAGPESVDLHLGLGELPAQRPLLLLVRLLRRLLLLLQIQGHKVQLILTSGSERCGSHLKSLDLCGDGCQLLLQLRRLVARAGSSSSTRNLQQRCWLV